MRVFIGTDHNFHDRGRMAYLGTDLLSKKTLLYGVLWEEEYVQNQHNGEFDKKYNCTVRAMKWSAQGKEFLQDFSFSFSFRWMGGEEGKEFGLCVDGSILTLKPVENPLQLEQFMS